MACKGCGYDLRAHAIGNRCPECGRTTFDSPLIDGERSITFKPETGSGLMKLSLILALIPLVGLLMIAKFGAVLAFLAAFSPIFHLAAIWSFRHSRLSAVPESRPWSANWVPAAVEMLVAIFAIATAIHLQSQSKVTVAWMAAIIIWPPVTGIRLAMTAHAGGLVVRDYGLRILWVLSIACAILMLISGIGIGITTLAVIQQTNLSTALAWALSGMISMGGIGIVGCWFINYLTQIVEGNLVWDIVNEHITSKDVAHEALNTHRQTERPSPLPPIPLAEEDSE